jgi:hypothetical protein
MKEIHKVTAHRTNFPSFIVSYFIIAWAYDGSRHPTREDIAMYPKAVAEIDVQTMHAITFTEESIGPVD